MGHDREVGGIRCMQVLAHLDTYLDGELSPEQLAQVQAHVAGCDWCAQFGSRYASVVQALRDAGDASPPEADGRNLARRLLQGR